MKQNQSNSICMKRFRLRRHNETSKALNWIQPNLGQKACIFSVIQNMKQTINQNYLMNFRMVPKTSNKAKNIGEKNTVSTTIQTNTNKLSKKQTKILKPTQKTTKTAVKNVP